MAEYEAAIDYLNHIGTIDPRRVGIVGFSRNVYLVAYTLTHSKYRFRAASFVDGIDGGYFQYLAWGPGDDRWINGGFPIGKNLTRWLQNSPAFNLDKIRTPLRLEAHGESGGVVAFWEWYAGLNILGRTVQFISFPDASHVLVKPWERYAAQVGEVDWFNHWLTDGQGTKNRKTFPLDGSQPGTTPEVVPSGTRR